MRTGAPSPIAVERTGRGVVTLWWEHFDETLQRTSESWHGTPGITRVCLYRHVGGPPGGVLVAESETVDVARVLAFEARHNGYEAGGYAHIARPDATLTDPLAGPYLFSVRVQPLAEWIEPFRSWLHGEHFEIQVRTPGLTGCRGHESLTEPFHFLNLWAIDDPLVPTSDEYEAIRETLWYREVVAALETGEVVRLISRLEGSR